MRAIGWADRSGAGLGTQGFGVPPATPRPASGRKDCRWRSVGLAATLGCWVPEELPPRLQGWGKVERGGQTDGVGGSFQEGFAPWRMPPARGRAQLEGALVRFCSWSSCQGHIPQGAFTESGEVSEVRRKPPSSPPLEGGGLSAAPRVFSEEALHIQACVAHARPHLHTHTCTHHLSE